MNFAFNKILTECGMTEDRANRVHLAIDELHMALCALDSKSIKNISKMGGLEGLLESYAKLEHVRNIACEIKNDNENMEEEG